MVVDFFALVVVRSVGLADPHVVRGQNTLSCRCHLACVFEIDFILPDGFQAPIAPLRRVHGGPAVFLNGTAGPLSGSQKRRH